jgi:DNA-binding GntR family transcriptional regulator
MTDPQASLGKRLAPLTIDGAPLAEKVFDIVGDAIATGVLPPGERVNDKEIASALGVSRTPVREALQRLTWVGLIEMAPSRYTRVTAVTEEAVASTLEYAGMQASVALRLAMRRMDAAELDGALVLLDEMIVQAEAGESRALLRASQEFLGYLVARSGNPVFMRVMKEADLLVSRNLRHLRQLPESAKLRTDAFRHLREAMLAGDADAAEHWFRAQHGVGVDLAL